MKLKILLTPNDFNNIKAGSNTAKHILDELKGLEIINSNYELKEFNFKKIEKKLKESKKSDNPPFNPFPDWFLMSILNTLKKRYQEERYRQKSNRRTLLIIILTIVGIIITIIFSFKN